MTFYLVDTSAWILSFSRHPPFELKGILEEGLDQDRIQICGVVISELLQGCRSIKESKQLQERFAALHYLDWSEPDWILLGETSLELRAKGFTVPIMDLMIAILAIRHRSILIHRDRHFDLIAKHLPLLSKKI